MAQTPSNTSRTLKIDRDLSALTSCDITTAWSLLKESVEKHIGKSSFACIPYITEGTLYDITSVFVKINQTGGAGRRIRTYRPLGLIEDLLVPEHSWEIWHNIKERVPRSDNAEYPDSFEITLRDDLHKTTISATFEELSKRAVPKDFSPVGQVTFNPAAKPDLHKAKKIYFINKVVIANTIRLNIVVNDIDRVLIYRSPQPIAFRYCKYALDSKKAIVQKISVPKMSSLRTTWIRLDVKENMLVPETTAHSLAEQGSEESLQADDEDIASCDDTVNISDNAVELSRDGRNEDKTYELETDNSVSV